MGRDKIKAFLIKDIKLVDVGKLILFLSFGIIYYYVSPVLFQYDNQGGVYLFGLGYQSIENIQKYMISCIATITFFAGISVIEFNENKALGFSFVAAKVKVRHMIIARALFCLIFLVVSEFIVLTFFVGILKFSFSSVFTLSLNVMIFSLLCYLSLIFLYSKKQIDWLIAIFVMIPSIYAPFFLTNEQIILINIIFAILFTFWMIIFCEKNYRRKLQVESSGETIGLSEIDIINCEIELALRRSANRLYFFIASILKDKLVQQQTLIFTDLHRIFQILKKLIISLIIASIVKGNMVVDILIIVLCTVDLIGITRKNCSEDYWVCQFDLIKESHFWKCKAIVAAAFNILILCVFNFVLFGLTVSSIIQGLSGAISLTIVSLILSWIILNRKT